jgi:hypothetical protein
MGRVSDLRESCAPYCSNGQIDDARSPLTVARVALGVGIVAGVGAVATYLLWPSGASARSGRAAWAPVSVAF